MNATPPPQKPNRLVGQGSSESKGKSGNVQFGSFESTQKPAGVRIPFIPLANDESEPDGGETFMKDVGSALVLYIG
ncbi:hypothetical protein E3N88_35844 [Mikania micrantha]|uniref:Uncharacterized protein n=1 Tax=Mikania micrantha TaxID=192012 RepID=A0A5N6M222_9ASTR|nr:hypothetical protein E3N88_35844 [Mikania micrantha]